MATLASVIILNYNTAALTLQALHSVLEKTTNLEQFEFLIVDNASETEDFLILKKGLAEINSVKVQLINSDLNLGYGGGNMLGVEKASGEYFIFMNSDVTLKEDSFNKMISFLSEHENIAVLGAQPEDEHGKTYKAFDYKLSLATELFSSSFLHKVNPKKYPNRRKSLTKPTKVGAVPGSLLLCRKKDFINAGGFDPDVFLFYEEKDLCFRIEQIGKEIYAFPYTSYIHLKGKSSKSNFATKKELKISQFYVIRKNLGRFEYCIFYFFSFLKFLIKSPFSNKNRKYLALGLKGFPLSESLKNQQKLQPAQK